MIQIQNRTINLRQVSRLRNDKSSDGWKLLKDIPATGDEHLELFDFMPESSDTRPLSEAQELELIQTIPDCAGQQHAERLLDIQDEIPVEWRGLTLAFPSTLWYYVSKWRDSYDRTWRSTDGTAMPAIQWNREKNRWELVFRAMSAKNIYMRGTNIRAVRIKNQK